MAEIVLSPPLEVVLDKLANPLLEDIANRFNLRKELKKLWRTLRVIRAVLEEAEERQCSDGALKIWLQELKEVAYDMEDLLDEFSALMSRHRGGFAQQVLNLVPFADFSEMLSKLKQIKETLETLAEERYNFSLQEGVVNTSSRSRSRSRRQTGSYMIQSEILGREDDNKRIVQVLFSTDNRTYGDVSVVSIVGLGGLGKTTLAQLVYHDEQVTRHFDMKMWVCVNDDFDVEQIMISIIESASKCKCDLFGLDVLQFRLCELLSKKRYLLVLDDVWNEDDNEWDRLRAVLRSGGEGSSIMVTTRCKKVASIMGSTYIHHLEGLSDENCWDLFKQRAFCRNEEEHTNLFVIGKQIAKKCGGIPLAAKTLGSLMRFKREEREWSLVLESDLWNVSESENGIFPALRLSYSHMPSHLKGCFAYCSIFPRNYIIKKEKLIHLWIAGGLIQSPKGIKSLEFIGNEYFDDLVWMFFFQDVQKSDSGNIIECKMHDIVHDLAHYVAGDEYMMLEYGNVAEDLSHIRHASVICNFNLHTIPEALYEAKKLRTLILVFPKGDLGEVPPNVFSSFSYLRVLDLSGSGIKRLHESISSIFLRDLDLSNTHILELPESVCNLCNLQVMNLSGCYNLIDLPSCISNMSKLRHLIISGCSRLIRMPALIGKLVFLRTLSMFIVGNEVGKSLNQLQSLNLGGELNIKHLENVRNVREAFEADLIGKKNLQSLILSWGDDHSSLTRNIANGDTHWEVLICLQPHKYIKKLSINGYQGTQFPQWIGAAKIPNITELTLINCRRCEYLPSLGELTFLKRLYLRGMDAVKNIGPEFYGEGTARAFPLLKELTLVDFPHLEFWWNSNRSEEFPSLVKLTVTKCSRLKNMPRFPCLQHLQLYHCSGMILRSALNLTSITNLVIDGFSDQLASLEKLLQNNALLTSLTISSCLKLHSIPPTLGKLTNLKSLKISWIKELHALPQELQNLSSLESLEIIECDNLTALPENVQGLGSLRTLSIENCNSLTSLPKNLQFLTALEHLIIMYCPKLVSLPEDLRHLSALKRLSILNCPELASLPEGLQYVTTLQNLELHGCPGLKVLPEWIENLKSLRSLALSECHNLTILPGGLQSVSSLQHLSIRDCPDLEERCKMNVGEDWLKIHHIAHVYIGSRESASSSCH